MKLNVIQRLNRFLVKLLHLTLRINVKHIVEGDRIKHKGTVYIITQIKHYNRLNKYVLYCIPDITIEKYSIETNLILTVEPKEYLTIWIPHKF